ncbi:MAG: primosomal protein N' [Acidobacteriota bacterium]
MFVSVAFPTALPEALTYSVPEALLPLARPGVRVRAPLRGRGRVGVIVGVEAEPGVAVERIVGIAEVLDDAPVVPPHVMDLIHFTAEYYIAPPGTVVRAALPAALLRLPPALVVADQRAHELLPTLSREERALVERVLAARRITVARLAQEGYASGRLRTLLAGLAARRVLKVMERAPVAHAGGAVTGVALVDMAPERRAALVGKAPAQQRVVAWLAELGRPALEGELARACQCTGGVIAALVRKGILRRFQQARVGAPRRWELAPPPIPQRLSADQQLVVEKVVGELGAGRFSPTLLLGITGSGKTEVYLRVAEAAAGRGLSSLILVPEIGLTPALAGQLATRFGERVAVLHSSLADGERFAAWQRVRRGQVDVVAGPRSAIWAPIGNLGLIVVDEEQDSSYKQDEEPRYNARDLALVLGQRLRLPVLLASATPSLESYWLARRGRVALEILHERVGGGELPEVEIVDLRGQEGEPGEHGRVWVSARLRMLLQETLARGEQAIILVNRRGWAPVLLCRQCGHQVTCRDCSIPLTVHRRSPALLCHYCGYTIPPPSRCPRCGGAVLQDMGAGTEKVAAILRTLFPEVTVDILDRDTARSPAQLLATLERFAAGGTHVLVGTQMVSKGHHFPRVTLTAVINADNLLGFADFRGAERCFQLLTQAAGRAGRGERPGRVVIQSYQPDHHAVRAAATHDTEGFLTAELRYRQAFRYPPITRLAVVRFEAAVEAVAHDAAAAAADALAPGVEGVRMLGPVPAPLQRLRGRFRVQLLLVSAGRTALREALGRVAAVPVPRGVRRVVDVDPQTTV